MSSFDVAIVGSGSWGKALAHTLSINKKKVLIYSRNPEDKKYKFNSKNILQTNDKTDIFSHDSPIVIATPVKSLVDIGELVKNNNYHEPIILACKGIDSKLGLFPSQIISQYTPSENVAVLSGPSFAAEVMQNKPTAVTIASENDSVLKIFTEMFHSKYFRVYASNDMIGCQLGGAMKNILSVAVGISDGLDLGANAKAALISRGMVEIKILGEILKCDEKTIYGLSGLGDLVLTSNDNLSRNRRFGLEIAKGLSVPDAEKKIGNVVEGIYASEGLNILIKKYALNLPICSKVFDIINKGLNPEKAVSDLLIREQKKEFV
ncbi:MAG: glycerol-3-phosphate dehydrogenase [Gammaproteobacteria bacterium]|nr:glycerol-3-phosphate dehydrogenase [Gammaproteobacteria bacterium]|tara:strand:- start:1571 stop:2530 length:960 start_codon:yes stop_codon:yes gene_type:complete